MESGELEDILGELEAMLEQLGYEPLVEQERLAAAGGRVVETTKEDRARTGGRGASRPEVGDVRRAPFTAAERIAMLLDLLEAAVGGTFAIEERVQAFAYENFSDASAEGRMPTFRPDTAEGFAVTDDRQWSLPTPESLELRRSSVRQVLVDLVELRNLVGVERDVALIPDQRAQRDDEQRVLDWA